VSEGGPDLPHSEREMGKLLPIVDPLHISRLAEAKDLKLSVLIDVWSPNQNSTKVGHRGGSGLRDLLLIFGTPSYLVPRNALETSAH